MKRKPTPIKPGRPSKDDRDRKINCGFTISHEVVSASRENAAKQRISVSQYVENALVAANSQEESGERLIASDEQIGRIAGKVVDMLRIDPRNFIIGTGGFEPPEIPLFHAAAGIPISADGDSYQPSGDLGDGRIACRLHGDSMAPDYPDGSTVILREKSSLKRPVLKRGEIYLFDIGGEKTLKIYDTRPAASGERAKAYRSTGGAMKVRVLRSINRDFPEIILDPADDPEWIGWLDRYDNPR